MRVLLVEDDKLLGDGIKNGLRQSGYGVDWLEDGISASQALQYETFDIIVLDIGLPGEDGLQVLQKLRNSGKDTPVIILTARDGVSDRVLGLDSGADDYLVKPFDLNELTARMRALTRRHSGRTEPNIHHANITLEPASHKVLVDDKNVPLSCSEYNILYSLLENRGKVLSRSRLEEILYGWDIDTEGNSLEVFIHHLRKKLGSKLIRTIRGVGYIIEEISE